MVVRVLPENHAHQPIRILLKLEVWRTDNDCKRGIFRSYVVKIIAISVIKEQLLCVIAKARLLYHIVQNVP